MVKKKELSFAEAKPLAGALANFLQQLQNAEAVLDAAMRAKVELGKLGRQVEDLRDEIEDLQGQRDHVKQLFDSERSRLGKLTDDAKENVEQIEVESRVLVEVAEKRGQNAMVLHEEAVKELEEDLEIKRHKTATKITELCTAVEDWEHKLQDAKKAHADFVAKITKDK